MPGKSLRTSSGYSCTACTCFSAILLLLLIFAGTADAQTNPSTDARASYLGVLLGSGIASYREDLLVPIDFHGPGFFIGAEFTKNAQSRVIDIRSKFGLSFLKNRFSHNAYAAILEIRSVWIRRLSYNQEYGELWGGICLPMKMNNLFMESWDDSHLYWLTTYSLGPVGEWHKQVSPGREISVHLGMPALSLISRPPEYRYKKQEPLTHLGYHFSGPNRALHLELPDDYRAVFARVAFTRDMNHAILNIGLEFEYGYCRDPKPIYALSTTLAFSYQWRI